MYLLSNLLIHFCICGWKYIQLISLYSRINTFFSLSKKYIRCLFHIEQLLYIRWMFEIILNTMKWKYTIMEKFLQMKFRLSEIMKNVLCKIDWNHFVLLEKIQSELAESSQRIFYQNILEEYLKSASSKHTQF